jgi:hypothetical protein
MSESDTTQARGGKDPEPTQTQSQMGQQARAVPKDQSDLDPFEINFLPQFEQGRGPREPFVNRHGVVIGDHDYESSGSPLMKWDKDTDPSIMAGEEWVHPYKDIGFHTAENRDYFEKGISPQSSIFMHPDKDAAYKYKLGQKDPGEEHET